MTSKRKLRRRIRRLKHELKDLWAMYWDATDTLHHINLHKERNP